MSNSPKVLGGPHYLLRGFQLLREPGIRPFAIIPLIINVIVIVFIFVTGTMAMSSLLDAWLSWLPQWLEWLRTLLWVIFAVGLIIILGYCFTLLANLIAAPFNGWLSARVEEHLTGKAPDTGMTLSQEAWHSIKVEIGLLWFFLSRAALLGVVSLILFWIPGVNALLPGLWFLFSAYMLALEYMDHPMANHGMNFKAKRRLLARNRQLSLSFGATATFFTAVPLVNLLIMPAAVAGATQAWVDQLQASAELTEANKPN
ncbi:MAG: sulfate transporter CysZ [Salinisphaeraceae bacterium]|nr:sulfate transporter CysZ [Salinisphaeraceae bacterium]